MSNNRLVYIDNIRSLIIILVVIAHVVITYSGIGGWYYVEKHYDEIPIIEFVVFGLFIGILASFSMGILFLFAGYFLPSGYDRKGFLRFIKDKLIRLFIPVLLYVFIIDPIVVYLMLNDYYEYPKMSFFEHYRFFIIHKEFLDDTGPLWFIVVLLVFSIFYACLRLMIFKKINFSFLKKISPNFLILFLIIVNTISTYYIRLKYPIGYDFYNFQLAFYSQYVILFILGIFIYRLDLLSKISFKFGLNWFIYGLSFSFLLFSFIAYYGNAINGDIKILGGPYWQSGAYAFFESIVCASIILGIIVIYRQWFNRHHTVSKFLSKHSFGVYVLHTPVVVGMALLFTVYHSSSINKVLVVTAVSLPLSYLLSYLLKKIKGLNNILS